jgi:hypothetical protein
MSEQYDDMIDVELEEYWDDVNSDDFDEDDTNAVPSKTVSVPPRSPNTSAAAVPEPEVPVEEEEGLFLERVV